MQRCRFQVASLSRTEPARVYRAPSACLPRSHLQRVNYRFEDEALWRESYPVLDRAGDTAGTSVRLLDGVEYLELGFLEQYQAALVEGLPAFV